MSERGCLVFVATGSGGETDKTKRNKMNAIKSRRERKT